MKRPINMTMKELEALSSTVETLKKSKRMAEIEKTRVDCLKIIQSRGLSVDEVFVNTGGPVTGKPKSFKMRHAQFVDPSNPQNVWSGRGRRPNWFLAQLKNGKKPTDMVAK